MPLSNSVLGLEREGQGQGWLSGLSLSLQGQEYFAGPALGFREGAESQWGTVGWRLTRGWGAGSGFAFVDVGSTFSQAESFNYLLPYQVYYQQRTGQWSWGVGRKRRQWSAADEFWKQGVWEPRAFHEKLHPEPLGLTGLWADLRHQSWTMGLFGSPFFIPEMGLHQSLQQGRFVSANPWFRPPEEILIFNGVPTPVRYDLVKPDIASVVFSPSLAMQLEHSGAFEGGYLRGSYAYKPMNQLLMGFPLGFSLQATGPGVILPIHPRVLYHQLYSVEAGLEQQIGWTSWLNLTREIPQAESAEEFWIHKSVGPAWIVSGYAGYDLSASGWGGSSIYGSFFVLDGGDVDDLGDLSTAGASRFERRYQYQQAVSVGLKWSDGGLFSSVSGLRSARLLTDQRVTYEIAQRMWWWSLRWDLVLDQAWSILFQADVMALGDQGPAQVVDGFLRDYRPNDRVVAGVSYVF